MLVELLDGLSGIWVKLFETEDQHGCQSNMTTNHWDHIEDSR